MIEWLNRLTAVVEDNHAEDLDVAALASKVGTTEHHVRRMLSALAGMPLSEYVRRRRMTVAAADVVAGSGTTCSTSPSATATRARARRSAERSGCVHGAGPGQVRRDGGPLRTQHRLKFQLTVEGVAPMDVRILTRPAFRLAGHAARVPLVH